MRSSRRYPLWVAAAFLAVLAGSVHGAVLKILPDTAFAEHIYEQIEITVAVADVDSLAAVACDLTFDPSLLEVIAVTEADFLRGSEPDSVATAFTYSQTAGRLVVGLTQLGQGGTGRSVASDTALFTVSFRVLAFGEGALSLSGTSLLQPDGVTEIAHTIEDGRVQAAYPSLQTSVDLDPDDTTVLLGRPVVVRLTVDSVLHLQGYSVDLSYPSGLLTLDSVAEGPLLSAGGLYQTALAWDDNDGAVTIGHSILQALDTGVTTVDEAELARLYFTATSFGSGTVQVQAASLFAPNGTSTYPVASLGQTSVAVAPVNANTAVTFNPPDTVVYETQQFRIAVEADDVDSLSAYSFDLSFDPAFIRLDSIGEGPVFNSQGHATYFAFDVDSITGTALFGASILSTSGAGVAITNETPLAYLYLTALQSADTDLRLAGASLFAPDGVTLYSLSFVGECAVSVLPTTEIVLPTGTPSGADTWVSAAAPSANFGRDSILTIEAGNARGLLQWGFGSIGSDALISSAYLSLYRSGGASSDTLALFYSASSWVDTIVTWITQPDTLTRIAVGLPGSGWCTWNVTEVVQAWVNGSQTNTGLVLAAPGGAGGQTVFASGEYASDTTLRPRLTINYYYPPTCPDLLPAGDIAFSKDPVVEGDTVEISVDIYNTGASSVGNARVRFYDGVPLVGQYTLIGEDILTAVPGYGFATATVNWPTQGRVGDRTIFIWVNPEQTIAECDTLNNKRSFFKRVLARPDLHAECAQLRYSSLTPTEGETVAIDIPVSNVGEAAARDFYTLVNLRRSGGTVVRLDSVYTIGPLYSGEVDTLHVTWNTTGYTGNSDLLTAIDAGSSVVEQSETDNSLTCPVTVYNPNLVLSPHCPTDANPNDTIHYTLQLSNVAAVAAYDVVANLALPDGLSLITSSVPADSGFTLQWSLDSLAGGQQFEVTLSLEVGVSLQSGSIVDIHGQTGYTNAYGLNPTVRSEISSLTIGDDVTAPQVLVSVVPGILDTGVVAVACTPSEPLLADPVVTAVSPGGDTMAVTGPSVSGDTYTFLIKVDSTVADGQVRIVVSVQDLAGNTGESIAYVLVDHQPPTASVTFPDTVSLGVHEFVLLSDEYLAVTPAVVLTDSFGQARPMTFQSKQGLTYHYTFLIDDSTAGGPAQITIPLVDMVGNDTLISRSCYVLNERPALAVTIPERAPKGSTQFVVTVDKPLAELPLVQGYDFASIRLTITGPAIDSNTYTYTLRVDSTTTQGLADISISVHDVFGNTADTTVSIMIDRTFPHLDIQPADTLLAGSYHVRVRSSEILAGAPQMVPYNNYGAAQAALSVDSILGDTLFWYSQASAPPVTAFTAVGADLAGNVTDTTRSYCDLEVLHNQIDFSVEPMQGTDVLVSVWVHNRGLAPLDSVPVEIWRGYPGYGLLLGETQWLSVAAGDSVSVSAIWPAAQHLSSFSIYVVVDRSSRFREFDETNNLGWIGSIGLISYTDKAAYMVGLDSAALVTGQVISLTSGAVLSDSIATVTVSIRDTTGQVVLPDQPAAYDPSRRRFEYLFNPTAVLTPGTYRVHIVADAGGPAARAVDSIQIQVYRGLLVSCSSDKSEYYRRDTVRITGTVHFVDSVPATSVGVITTIKNNGGTRLIQSTTDTTGNFTAVLITNPLEAGAYTAISDVLLAGQRFADTAEFAVQGLLLTPSSYALTMSQNSTHQITVAVKNIGTRSLDCDSIKTSACGSPGGVVVALDLSSTDLSLAPNATTTFSANVAASPTADPASTHYIDLFFDDTLSERMTVAVTTQTARPYITGSPASPEFYLTPGASLTKKIRVSNQGYTAWRDIAPQADAPDWLSVRLPGGLDSLGPGQQFTMELTATALQSLAPGVYDTTYGFRSSNYQDVEFAIRLYITDTTTGSIRFAVSSSAGDTLPGATVRLYSQTYDPVSHSYPVYSSVTDSTGYCDFEDLPATPYAYQVAAANFQTASGTVVISAGQGLDVIVPVVLEPQPLTINWTVEDTTLEDGYNVTLDVTYNTSVPFLVMSPHVITHYGTAGDDVYGTFSLSNLGERAADVVSFEWPTNEYFSVQMNGEVPWALVDGLEPGETVEIPYHLHFLADVPSCRESVEWLTIKGFYNDEGFSGEVPCYGQFLVTAPCDNLIFIPPIIATVDLPCQYENNCECDLSSFISQHSTDHVRVLNLGSSTVELLGIFSFEMSVNPLAPFFSALYAGMTISEFTSLYSQCADVINGLGVGTPWDPPTIGYEEYSHAVIHHERIHSLIPGVAYSFGQAWVPYLTEYGYAKSRFLPILRVSLNDLAIGQLIYCLFGSYQSDYVNPSCPTCTGEGGPGGSGSWSSGFRPIPKPPDVPDDQGGIVRLQLNQHLSVERQAFTATLELVNGFDTYTIENLNVEIEVADSLGTVLAETQYVPESPLFFAAPDLGGLSDISGAGIIPAGDTGSAHWLIIPKADAGGMVSSGRRYFLTAELSYEINGQPFTYRTPQEPVTVLPQPQLALTYLLPTAVEAGVPFDLALVVSNVGYGTAHDLQVDADQPIVLDGSEFLDYFRIIGAAVNGQPTDYSLVADFGELPPGESKVANWTMEASPRGTIDEFSVSFEHSDALGGDATSLIVSAGTQRILRAPIRRGSDDAGGKSGLSSLAATEAFHGALVDAGGDPNPDAVWNLLDARSYPVAVLQPDSLVSPTFQDPVMTIYHGTSNQWLYLRTADPFLGTKEIETISREDGSVVPGDNYWTDSSSLHVCDYPYNSTRYTVHYGNLTYKPDLFVPADSIAFTACPGCGEIDAGDTSVTISFAVCNLGSVAAADVPVYVYDGAPIEGKLIDSVIIDSLPADSLAQVAVTWHTGPEPDWVTFYHRIYVVANPHGVINEVTADNNVGNRGVDFHLSVGDVNHDAEVNITDIVYEITWIFRNGPLPVPILTGDVNCDIIGNIVDVVAMVNYLFRDGPPPCDPRLPGQKIPAPEETPQAITVRAEQIGEQNFLARVRGAIDRPLAGVQQDYLLLGGLTVDSVVVGSLADSLPVFWSVISDTLRLGVVDPTGRQRIQPGEGELLRIGISLSTDGESSSSALRLLSTIAADTAAGMLMLGSTTEAISLHAIPSSFVLRQNYPNPFNPSTSIEFGLPQSSRVKLTVYNILGQQVRVLIDGQRQAGYHTIAWDGRAAAGNRVASGVYFYRIEAGDFKQSRKMVLLK